ncbi:hypothetical protein [Neptunicella sp. SCSIO 80796]|uniref:hypothetical protein n=1 Tax=Neptunicella plasticusilytica TaxID=3117012 RepID=UPI003A4D9AFE
MKRILSALIVLMLAPASVLAAEKHLNLDANDIKQLRTETGAGALHIHGEDVEEIQVKAILPDELNAEDYRLALTAKGDKALLIAKLTEQRHHYNQGIDIEIIVPRTIQLDVYDGSGDSCIRTISGNVNVHDSSGDLALYTISGDVDITDSSGDLVVNTLTGNLNVQDSSGGIEIVTLTGELQLRDSSGDIYVDSVTGPASIEDGSGDIEVKNASFVHVISDGTGQRRFHNVAKVVLPDSD